MIGQIEFHYILGKHAPYVTGVLYRAIMQATYDTSMSAAQIITHFIKEITNLFLIHCLLRSARSTHPSVVCVCVFC